MAIEKDVKITIRADSASAERAFKSFQNSATELNAKFTNLERAFSYLGKTLNTLGDSLEVGQTLTELSTAFDNLYGKTSLFAARGIAPLRQALGGLVKDIDILETANFAAQSGLSPETLLKIAQSAEALGDTLQRGPTEAFNDLTAAIAKGSAKQLELYGIHLEGIESSKKLGEALRQMSEKAAKSGEVGRTARDAYEQMVVTFANSWAAISRTTNQSELLAKALDYLAGAARGAEIVFNRLFGPETIADVDKRIQQTGLKIKEMAELTYLGGDAEKQKVLKGLEQQMFELFKHRDEILKKDAASNRPTGGEAVGKPSFDPFAGGLDNAKKQLEDLKKQWGDFKRDLNKETLSKAIDKAIETGDRSAFQSLKEEFMKATSSGLEEAFKGISDPNKQRYFAAATEAAVLDYETKFEEAAKRNAEQQQKELQQAFEGSVDFFADIFENAITGTTFNLEDALKRLAIGFASTIAASIAQSFGLNFSGVGGLQGFGGAIAGSLIQGLGGSFVGNTLGSLFTKGTAPAVPQLISATAGVGSGAVAGTEVAGTSLAATLGTAAIAGLVAVALPFALAGATKFFGKIFGGSQDPDELARRAFRDKLTKTGLGDNLSLPTVQGNVNIAHIDHSKFDQFFANKPFKDQAVALASPLSQVLTGGGKLGEDFANIFAQAIGNANNYNEVIINTLSLMGKLGLTAGEAKDQLKELFLDGKVSLDQFAVGVQNLNFIAQEDLVGPNSVADALHALATAVDNPRIQLKALELAFKEMSQLGITKSNDIYQYLMEKFGPGVADVFKALTDAGIDTWEEIKNASVDQLVVIFNALKNFSIDADATMSRVAKQVTTVFADSGTKAATEFDKATQPIIRRIKEIGEEAVKTGGVLDAAIKDLNLGLQSVDTKLGDVKTKAGGITGTIPNNEFRA